MIKKYGTTFARRGPDPLIATMAGVLAGKGPLEFAALFDLVLADLRARNAAGSGGEMLRLRVYEKLQYLVNEGMVKKTISKNVKKYSAMASLSSLLPAAAAS
jgi:hypothetical protein